MNEAANRERFAALVVRGFDSHGSIIYYHPAREFRIPDGNLDARLAVEADAAFRHSPLTRTVEIEYTDSIVGNARQMFSRAGQRS